MPYSRVSFRIILSDLENLAIQWHETSRGFSDSWASCNEHSVDVIGHRSALLTLSRELSDFTVTVDEWPLQLSISFMTSEAAKNAVDEIAPLTIDCRPASSSMLISSSLQVRWLKTGWVLSHMVYTIFPLSWWIRKWRVMETTRTRPL